MNVNMQSDLQESAAESADAVCIFPATSAQRRLWFLDQLQPGGASYNISWPIRICGDLNVEALERCLNEIVHRHEILRTTFSMVNGEPAQVVAAERAITLAKTDLSADAQRDQQALQVAALEGQRPLDLKHGPLVRARLLRLDAQKHVLVLTLHHIVFDGWSRGILVRELAALYEAFAAGGNSPLAKLSLQFVDYAVWQQKHLQGKKLQRQLEFWKGELAGAPTSLDFPTDRPRASVQTFNGAARPINLPPALAQQLNAMAHGEGATLFMVMLAAFEVLLARHSGQNDLLIGTPIANRNRIEIEGLIGLFANTLVLRARLSDELSFRDLLRRVQKGAIAAYAHQDLPFEKLVQELRPERNLNRNPLFQVLFSLQNAPRQEFQLPGLELTFLETGNTTAKFDFSMFLTDTSDGLRGRLEYSTDLFDAATIDRLVERYQVLLEAVVADASVPISKLRLLSARERRRLLIDFNATQAEFATDVCMQELFERRAQQMPDAVALVCGAQQMTYGTLNSRANQLARFLRHRGVGPEELVAICTTRCADMLVGIMGILKAGGAYVPLDPAYPKSRQAAILQDSRARLVLTQRALTADLPEYGGELICLEERWSDIAAESDRDLERLAQPHNLAYVLFTSGSTGRPKGVALEHRSAVTFIQWAGSVYTPAELAGVLFSTSLCFDLSIFEIFAPLSSGGKVIVVENALELPTLAARDQVTLINTVPSAMAELVRMRAVPDSVAIVNLAGEALSRTLVREVYAAARVQKVFNLYGPTEDTTYSTYTLVQDGQPVTIGRPVANTQAYVLDRYCNPAPIGVPGELFLAGEGLARGYYGRPDLTAERFLPNPFGSAAQRMYRTGDLCRWLESGEIEYLGRIDHQVKLRGFRIELGEIEGSLAQHVAVAQSVAMVREDQPSNRSLVAYVVFKHGASATPSELRAYLKRTLPDYMIPSFFVTVDALPMTPNGKIDRMALPVPDYARADQSLLPVGAGAKIAPRDDFELIVFRVWQRTLRCGELSVTDDFFELGGHSLLAVRMINELKLVSGFDVPLAELFRDATIEHLAEILRGDSSPKAHRTLMEIQAGGSAPPFFAAVTPGANALGYLTLSRILGRDQPFFKLQGPGELLLHRPYTDQENEQLAIGYVRLMRAVQPEGPYYIGGMCEGARIAFDMARVLEFQGQTLALVAIFDTWAVENSQIRWLWYFHAYAQRFRRLWRLSPSGKWGAVKQAFRNKTQRTRETGAFDLKAWHAYYWPHEDFVPKRINAMITEFKIKRQPYYYIRDPHMGWASRTNRGVEIHNIRAKHLQMLREPWVQNLGRALGESLRRAQESNGSRAPPWSSPA
jgi:amino acid adenylation domain-containing protein